MGVHEETLAALKHEIDYLTARNMILTAMLGNLAYCIGAGLVTPEKMKELMEKAFNDLEKLDKLYHS